jgi:hypothetical protein
VVDPKNGELVEITDAKELTRAFLADDEDESEEEKEVLDKDNRDIVDNNKAQKMSH